MTTRKNKLEQFTEAIFRKGHTAGYALGFRRGRARGIAYGLAFAWFVTLLIWAGARP